MKLTLQSLISAISLALFAPTSINASTFSFDFRGGNVASAPDPHYEEKYGQGDGTSLDTTSRVYTSASTYDGNQPNSPTPNLVATMSGHYYDSDPAYGTDWGLLDQSSLEFTEKPEIFDHFVIKYGIRPSEVGSIVSVLKNSEGELADASFLEFKLSSDSEVLFTELELTIVDLVAIESTDVVWASTTADEGASPVVPVLERDEDGEKLTLTFTWNDLAVNEGADKDVYMRIYGLKGSDYGNFQSAALRGVIIPPVGIPEPSGSVLCLLGMITIGLRRKRSSHGQK